MHALYCYLQSIYTEHFCISLGSLCPNHHEQAGACHASSVLNAMLVDIKSDQVVNKIFVVLVLSAFRINGPNLCPW